MLGENEQLIIKYFTETVVVNGPRIQLVSPFIKKAWKQKAISLSRREYLQVKDLLTGEQRVEKGPKLVFLKAHDDPNTRPMTAISLRANEYVRFQDLATGKVRIEKGEQGCVVPGPNEILMEEKRSAIDLRCYEYVRVLDKNTGTVRVERGEKVVFLDRFEELIDGGKNLAVEIDENTAVLVRDKRTGQQKLMVEKQIFIPEPDEEVIRVQNLIKLADYEACIVRDKDGKDEFFFGKNDDQRSFFLPPYSELVQLRWSRGRRRARRDLLITKIDLRPMYMSFEFNCRTADNVELVLEGSFFWEVVDLEAMVKFTNDTTGDICNHARSMFIQKVSRVTLAEFMRDFNKIAEQVHRPNQGGDKFYEQRGCLIHSLEVTGYHCADEATARVLGQIIQETTNRMNRLQQQESENEVQLAEIQGDIAEEKARGELLKVQTANSNTEAQKDGLAEAERAKTFLESLASQVPDLKTRIDMWKVLRKRDALEQVSKGDARLYFTPRDCDLSIQSHEHEYGRHGDGSPSSLDSFSHVERAE